MRKTLHEVRFFFLSTLESQTEFMKFILAVAVLFFIIACAEKASEKMETSNTEKVSTDVDTVVNEVKEDPAPVESVKLLPTDGQLSCKNLGEIDYVPVYEVLVSFQKEKVKIGKCNACLNIPVSDFSDHQIPENAIAARGGWYAGGGDYFYTIEDKEGNLAVYQGWQDEGQSVDDFSFHWKCIKTFKLN